MIPRKHIRVPAKKPNIVQIGVKSNSDRLLEEVWTGGGDGFMLALFTESSIGKAKVEETTTKISMNIFIDTKWYVYQWFSVL